MKIFLQFLLPIVFLISIPAFIAQAQEGPPVASASLHEYCERVFEQKLTGYMDTLKSSPNDVFNSVQYAIEERFPTWELPQDVLRSVKRFLGFDSNLADDLLLTLRLQLKREYSTVRQQILQRYLRANSPTSK